MTGLKFDKHVSVGHIVTTVVIAIGGISAWFEMVNRINLLEQREMLREESMIAMRKEFREDIKNINGKLDMIIIKMGDR